MPDDRPKQRFEPGRILHLQIRVVFLPNHDPIALSRRNHPLSIRCPSRQRVDSLSGQHHVFCGFMIQPVHGLYATPKSEELFKPTECSGTVLAAARIRNECFQDSRETGEVVSINQRPCLTVFHNLQNTNNISCDNWNPASHCLNNNS